MHTTEPNSHAHLPSEILHSIFLYAQNEDPRLFVPSSRCDPRSSILHVCSSWRVAALGLHELWTDVVILLDPEPSLKIGVISIAHQVLKRAHGAPLCLAVQQTKEFPSRPQNSNTPVPDDFIDKIIIPYAKSIKRLRLFVPYPFVRALLKMPCQVHFPILELFSLTQTSLGVIPSSTLTLTVPVLKLPKVRTVELGISLPQDLPRRTIGIPINFIPWTDLTTFINCRPMSVLQCMDILSLCQRLKLCSVVLEEMTSRSGFSKITLAHVERLHIRFSSLILFVGFLEECLELPVIRDLALKEEKKGLGWSRRLSQFLENQCGSQLEEVFVASTHQHWDGYEGFEGFLLKHSTSLRKLYIPISANRLDNGIVRGLISRGLCPRLEKLSLALPPWGFDQSVGAITDGVNEAEKAGREPVNQLHITCGSNAELLIHRRMGEWHGANMRCTYSVYSSGTPLSLLERNWFGYVA